MFFRHYLDVSFNHVSKQKNVWLWIERRPVGVVIAKLYNLFGTSYIFNFSEDARNIINGPNYVIMGILCSKINKWTFFLKCLSVFFTALISRIFHEFYFQHHKSRLFLTIRGTRWKTKIFILVTYLTECVDTCYK